MAQTAPKDQTETITRDDAVARMRQLRAEIAELNRDLSDEEKEAITARLAREVKAGMAERARKRLQGRG